MANLAGRGEEERKEIAGILLHFHPSFRHPSILSCCYVHHFRRQSRRGLEIVLSDWMNDKA